MDPEPLALSLRATGAAFMDALGMVCKAGMDPCSSQTLRNWADAELREAGWEVVWPEGDPQQCVASVQNLLDRMAGISPAFTGAVLASCKALKVNGDLRLIQKGALERLPEKLAVYGSLSIDCEAFSCEVTLPKGLKVSGNLEVHGSRWDGKIPKTALIEGEIFVGAIEKIMGLQEWRERYGIGSCLP